MRIIFVSKNVSFNDKIKTSLSSICEQDSIAFFNSYSEAEDFIDNHIIKEQAPLDLIITENNIQRRKAVSFYQRITRDKERTFSNRDFNFCTIPVVLIVDKNENARSFLQYGFKSIIPSIDTDRLHLFVPDLIGVVRSWRRGVIDELENMGIHSNSGIIDYSYFFSGKKRKNVSTNIISENFKLIPRRLDYYWITLNKRQIEKAIDLFIRELKRSTRLNKKQDEKKFHELFKEYPFLLKRDNYSRHWYEPRLHYEKDKYYEPDFGLMPNFQQRSSLSILELKLPNEKFIKKTHFHPSLYGKLMNHIFQVNDYKEYFESDQFQTMVHKVFGYTPTAIDYNILIGRLDDKNDSLSILSKRMNQMNAMHINLMTYDELLSYQVSFLERIDVLNIF